MKDIKLFVPHTEAMRPIVPEVLERVLCLHPVYIFMGGDEYYHRLLSDLWEDQEDVIIVEHDVLPWPGAIEELAQCPYPWCSCSYKIGLSQTGKAGYGIYHTFGCTKFSSHFMGQLPYVWSQIESRHWRHLDAQLSAAAVAVGQIPHPHRPPVLHLHKHDHE